MKTATEALKNEQIKTYQRYWRQVLLYRTSWNSSTNKYEWEVTPVDLERYLSKLSSIKWKLDTDALNEWKVSNTSIEVYNLNNDWSIDNQYGIFGNGKFARGSKVIIKAGNYLADESKELLYVFTGVIDRDLEFDLENKTCRIPLTSLDFLLQRTNAEDVGWTDQLIDDGNKTEYLLFYRTGRVVKVMVDSVEQFAGKDFSISNLNDPDTIAKVTFFSLTPPGTDNVVIDYSGWYGTKKIDWLVEELVKESGITDYQIDPAIWDNLLTSEWEQTTTADFNAGTKTDVTVVDDKVYLEMQNKSLYGITVVTHGGSHTKHSGEYSNINDNDEDTAIDIELWYESGNSGYVGIYFSALEGIVYLEILQEYISGMNNMFVDYYYDGGWHNKGIITLTGSKSTITFFFPQKEVQTVRLRKYGGTGSTRFYLYEFRVFGYSTTGNLRSQTKNCSVDITAFGKLDYTGTSPLGTELTLKTQSSINGTDWEAEKSLGTNGQVQSTPQQYFRWRAYFDNNTYPFSPTLFDVTLTYYTSDLTITQANFTGMDCYTAIKKLAEFVDYEFGFNAEGKFFFRSKEVITDSVLTLSDQDDTLVQLSDLTKGWDSVYNWIEATYGSYTKWINPIDRNETRPHSIDKYGFRRLTLSGGQLLISDEVDISTGIARRYYGKFDSSGNLLYYHYPTPKFLCSAKIKFLPQLDLSDVVTVEYLGSQDGQGHIFKFDSWQFKDFKFAPIPILESTKFKIIGLEVNPEKFYIDLDLKELDTQD